MNCLDFMNIVKGEALCAEYFFLPPFSCQSSVVLRIAGNKPRLAVRTDEGLTYTPDEEVMIHRLPRTPTLDLNALITIEWRQGEVW